MAHNIRSLRIFFKEFTPEEQDLTALSKLESLELNCLSMPTKPYSEFSSREMLVKFFNAQQVDVVIKLTKHNVEMAKIVERFNFQLFLTFLIQTQVILTSAISSSKLQAVLVF